MFGNVACSHISVWGNVACSHISDLGNICQFTHFCLPVLEMLLVYIEMPLVFGCTSVPMNKLQL